VAARRRTRERQVTAMPEPAARCEEVRVQDWQPVLDKALNNLPQKYRAAIVLCDLEGTSYKDAARQLGWPEGTLSVRLMRARNMLARRLAKKDGPVLAAALPTLLAEDQASAVLPPKLVLATVQTAGLLAAGQALSAGAISPRVAALMDAVLKALLLSKLKAAAGVFLLSLLAIGAAILVYAAIVAQGNVAQQKSDQELIQGSWTLVKMERDGQAIPLLNQQPCIFTGNRFRKGGQGEEQLFKLDSGKNPREIDLIAPGVGVAKGIYALAGDSLQISLSIDGDSRPFKFATSPGSQNVLMVLKKK
jgi:uncharacterized protein (TIGR03067 family)